MGRTGRASVMSGKDFEIREYPVPEVEPGRVLMKQELGGICGTDLHNWQFQRLGYEVILGHENVGTLETLGTGVHQDTLGNPVKVGDRVVVSPSRGIGWKPAEEAPHLKGGFGQYIYVWDPATMFIKTDLPSEIAVLTEPSACSYHCVTRARIRLGDTLVIQGTVPIGLLANRLGEAGGLRPADRGGRPRRTAGVCSAARRRHGDQHRRSPGRRGAQTDRPRQHAGRQGRRHSVRMRRIPGGDCGGARLPALRWHLRRVRALRRYRHVRVQSQSDADAQESAAGGGLGVRGSPLRAFAGAARAECRRVRRFRQSHSPPGASRRRGSTPWTAAIDWTGETRSRSRSSRTAADPERQPANSQAWRRSRQSIAPPDWGCHSSCSRPRPRTARRPCTVTSPS